MSSPASSQPPPPPPPPPSSHTAAAAEDPNNNDTTTIPPTPTSIATTDELLDVLHRYWGHPQFRPHQQQVIEEILYGRDVVLLMATGRGKSLTYQLPSLVLREKKGFRCVTIVISPLLALIEDQVAGLRANGVSAVAIGANTPPAELQRAIEGEYALLYITPEKLEVWMDGLTRIQETVGIACVAIDEAHCVSQWGHDFRSSYLLLHKIREQLVEVPLVAVTATATQHVLDDIVRLLRLNNPLIIRSSVNRPNLHYTCTSKSGSTAEDLAKVLRGTTGSCMIYVLTKNEAEELARVVTQRLGIPAVHYHGGMTEMARKEAFRKWSSDEARVVCGTVALGMGVDKPDVRYIINYGLTKSLEDYYQMTGRAGRDGLPSRCTMFWGAKDIQTLNYLAQHSGVDGPNARSASEQAAHYAKKIEEMQKFARAAGCRRKALLAHFGEELPLSGGEEGEEEEEGGEGGSVRRCCDWCDATNGGYSGAATSASGAAVGGGGAAVAAAAAVAAGGMGRGSLTVSEYNQAARHILTAVDRMHAGARKSLLLLQGSEIKEIRERKDYLRLKTCPAWGVAKQSKQGESWWKAFLEQLQDNGYIQSKQVQAYSGTGNFYQVLELSPKGVAFLRNPRAVLEGMMASQALVEAEGAARLEQQRTVAREEARKAREQEKALARSKEDDLLQALIQARAEQAVLTTTKAYQIADETFLRQLAKSRPSSLEGVRKLGGLGEAKMAKYGQAFLEVLNRKSRELGLPQDLTLLGMGGGGVEQQQGGGSGGAGGGGAGGGGGASGSTSFSSPRPVPKLTLAMQESHRLFVEVGKTIHQIATERAKPIQESTVRSYLATTFMHGMPLNWERMDFPPGLVEAVKKVMHTYVVGGGGGVGNVSTKELLVYLPEFYRTAVPLWGDVEAVRVMLVHGQGGGGGGVGGGGGGSGSGSVAAAGAGVGGGRRVSVGTNNSNGGGGSDDGGGGEWLTTRKRPASASSSAALQLQQPPARRPSYTPNTTTTTTATGGGGGGGGGGGTAPSTGRPSVHVPRYASGGAVYSSTSSNSTTAGKTTPGGAGTALLQQQQQQQQHTTTPQQQQPRGGGDDGGLLPALTPPVIGHQQQQQQQQQGATNTHNHTHTHTTPTAGPAGGEGASAAKAEDVLRVLRSSPNGLTVAEIRRKVGLRAEQRLGGCLTALQEEGLIYKVENRFKLL